MLVWIHSSKMEGKANIAIFMGTVEVIFIIAITYLFIYHFCSCVFYLKHNLLFSK